MKTIKIVVLLLTFSAVQMNAQEVEVIEEQMEIQTGTMNAEVIHTLAYTTDGVQRPYKVTIRESRKSISKFAQEDKGKIDQDRIPTPENVAVLLTITNPYDVSDNRVISMRYDKQVNDAFKLESSKKGFTVSVDDKKLEYTMGQGITYPNPEDQSYFKADEFSIVK